MDFLRCVGLTFDCGNALSLKKAVLFDRSEDASGNEVCLFLGLFHMNIRQKSKFWIAKALETGKS